MNHKTPRFIIDFFSSLIFSIIGFILFAFIYQLLIRINLEFYFGGCKSNIFVGLFFGMPLGSIIGILLAERKDLEFRIHIFINILLGILFCLMGALLGVVLLDQIGGWSIVFVPILMGLFSTVGFMIGSLILKSKPR